VGRKRHRGFADHDDERVMAYDSDRALGRYVPPTPGPCPVCGAGANQSSAPQDMSAAVCYCGHPRYLDDYLDWKPSSEPPD
jgi:hypothetical protein